MKNLKRCLSAALALMLVVSMVPGAFAWGGFDRNRSNNRSESTERQGEVAATTGTVSGSRLTLAANPTEFTEDSKPVTFTVTFTGDTSGAWSYAYKVGNGSLVTVNVASGSTSTISLTLTDTTVVTVSSVTDAAGVTTKPNARATVTKTGSTTTYSVTYHANGSGVSGSVPTDSNAYKPNDLVTVAGQGGLVREGYTFKGWSKTSNGEVTGNFPIAGNTTLYAVWEQNAPATYAVTYNSNLSNGPVTMEQVTAGDSPKSLTQLGWSAPANHKFLGWSTNPNATEADRSITVNGAMTLYAVYEDTTPATVKVTFDVGGGSAVAPADVEAGSTYKPTQISSRSGYTFKGWSETKNGNVIGNGGVQVAAATTLYAVWEQDIVRYIVSFDANGGDKGSVPNNVTLNAGETLDYATLKTPTRSGYTFSGWSTEKKGPVSSGIAVNSDLTLYAIWEREKPNRNNTVGNLGDDTTGGAAGDGTADATFTLTFDLNGGTGTPPDAITGITADVKANIPDAKPTRDGYEFLGWAFNKAETNTDLIYTPGTQATVTANRTLYAQWKKVEDKTDKATITYNLNDGSKKTASVEVEVEDKGTKVALPDLGSAPLSGWEAPKGEKFVGWAENEKATSAKYKAGDDLTVTDDIELFAVMQRMSMPTLTIPKITALQGAKIDLKQLVTADSNATLTFYKSKNDADTMDSTITVENGTTTYYVKAKTGEGAETDFEAVVVNGETRAQLKLTDTTISGTAGEIKNLKPLVEDPTLGSQLKFYEQAKGSNTKTPISDSVALKADTTYYVRAESIASPSNESLASDYLELTNLKVEAALKVEFETIDTRTISSGAEVNLYAAFIKNLSGPTGMTVKYYEGSSTTPLSFTDYTKAVVTPKTTTKYTIEVSYGGEKRTKDVTITVVAGPTISMTPKVEFRNSGAIVLKDYISNYTALVRDYNVSFWSDERNPVNPTTRYTHTSSTKYYVKAADKNNANVYTIATLEVVITSGSTYRPNYNTTSPPTSNYDLAYEMEKSAYDALYTKILSATSGTTVSHSATTYTKIPFYVVDALAGKNIKLDLTYTNSGTKTVTIDCSRVPKTGKNRIWFEAPQFASLYAK